LIAQSLLEEAKDGRRATQISLVNLVRRLASMPFQRRHRERRPLITCESGFRVSPKSLFY